MSLLAEIQEALLREGSGIGPILLKVRYLAHRLGVPTLEDWVRYETEGYPEGAPVPTYRKAGLSYTGTFSDGIRTLNNVPIASHAIAKIAGDRWIRMDVRESISVIDDWVLRKENEGQLGVDAGNLALLLTEKLYVGMTCISASGVFNAGTFGTIQNAVRSRLLDLTLEFEKAVPASVEIGIGSAVEAVPEAAREHVTQFVSQTVYGDVMMIASSGAGSTITVNNSKGDLESLRKALADAGIPEADADLLAETIAEEAPESMSEPFGAKTRRLLASGLAKAGEGAWNVGLAAATTIVKEAALRYYGLK